MTARKLYLSAGLVLAWLLFVVTRASAATDIGFSPATDGTYRCITYCTGFTTDDPAHSVQYVNLQYAGAPGFTVTVQVDGKTYQGTTPLLPPVGVALINREFDSATQSFTSDNSYVITTLSYTLKRTCTRSGRGQHCTSWYFVTGGSVTLP